MPNQQTMECMSPDCSRPFKIARFSNLDTSWERGKIVCPHCGAVMTGPSNFVYLAYPLTEAEEQRFDANKQELQQRDGDGQPAMDD